jgi:hypothetical protein
VITEEDYVEFLSRMTTNTSSAVPAQFYQYSRSRSFLFLGYSLRDWNLRVVMRNLRRQFENLKGDENSARQRSFLGDQSTAVAARAEAVDRRNVEIFDMEIEEFVRQLAVWKTRG